MPSTDLDSFFSHVRHEPLALFHSDASPTIDKLIKEFNQAVTIADQLAADQSGRRKGTAGEEYAASTAGTIVGLFERAFACSEQARVRRDDVSQLAARVIEKTGVIGVSDELPEGGDPLEWARRQESAGRLGILLYTRARSIPSDLRDEMLSARGSELTFPCPSR